MDDKPQGGEAPQPEKPKKPTVDILEFSFGQLMPIASFKEDGVLYITFLVSDEFYLTITEFDYYAFQNTYFSQLADCLEKEVCSCDTCILDEFTLINENDELTINIISEEGEETKKKTIPHYLSHSLAQNLIVGLNHEH